MMRRLNGRFRDDNPAQQNLSTNSAVRAAHYRNRLIIILGERHGNHDTRRHRPGSPSTVEYCRDAGERCHPAISCQFLGRRTDRNAQAHRRDPVARPGNSHAALFAEREPHARTADGVSHLSFNVPVEVEEKFEVGARARIPAARTHSRIGGTSGLNSRVQSNECRSVDARRSFGRFGQLAHSKEKPWIVSMQ